MSQFFGAYKKIQKYKLNQLIPLYFIDNNIIISKLLISTLLFQL